jgi:hypothetical protein
MPRVGSQRGRLLFRAKPPTVVDQYLRLAPDSSPRTSGRHVFALNDRSSRHCRGLAIRLALELLRRVAVPILAPATQNTPDEQAAMPVPSGCSSGGIQQRTTQPEMDLKYVVSNL